MSSRCTIQDGGPLDSYKNLSAAHSSCGGRAGWNERAVCYHLKHQEDSPGLEVPACVPDLCLFYARPHCEGGLVGNRRHSRRG